MIWFLTQSVPVDPDWLLSSTAQSAAVLVAIVGGFLVSRLVTLSAERSAILQRRQRLEGRRQIKQVEYDEVHADRLAISIKWFVDHHKDKLLECGDVEAGSLEVESLLDFIPVGSSYQEMRPVAENMRTAFQEIETKFSDSEIPPPQTSRELRESGVLIPEGSEYIYELVAEHMVDSVKPAAPPSTSQFAFSLPVGLTSFVPTPDIVIQRQDARIDLERQLSSELRALNSELALIDEELSAFKKPEGIKGAIIALTYLALVGIALPTVLMALRPVPDGPVFRVVVVAAFISGLILLLAYLLFRVRSLKPPES